jgi:very-short-patch-repair endonuclease
MKHISQHMTAAIVQICQREALFAEYIKHAEEIGERFSALRAIYSTIGPDLVEAGREWTDPYNFDFCAMQSPIERLLWSDIRGNMLGLYPEYPVSRFYVDFYNPAIRVGIEADGKQWHSKERDTARDNEIFQVAGAALIRVTGAECHRGADTPYYRLHEGLITKENYDHFLEEWYLKSSAGVVKAMSVIFCGLPANDREYSLSLETLYAHCLVPQALDHAIRTYGIVRRETFLEAA